MRVAEVKVYTFDELDDKAKERALERARERLNRYFEPEPITEMFEEILEEEGLPTGKTYWRLAYCQGDGVGFYGKVDLETFVAKNKLKSKIPKPLASGITFYSAFSFHITDVNHHYHHWNSGSVDFDEDDYGRDCPERWLEIARWLRDEIQEKYAEVSRRLEKLGYEEIEYQNSDEYVKDYIESDENEFEASGKEF